MRRHYFIIICFLLFGAAATEAQQWRLQPNSLVTDGLKMLRRAWRQYPQPQLKRSDWMNLNGLWDYSITRKNKPVPAKFDGKILVPFCVESALSGVKAFLPESPLL